MGLFGNTSGKWALLACLASTLFMTGLIWFVQVVHYPLFAEVDPARFRRYHAAHTRETTRVVLIPMILELLSSVVLVLGPGEALDAAMDWAGLIAAGGSWFSTFSLQVPRHNRLAAGYDHDVHRGLVATNRLRAACWTAHSAILLVTVARRLF